MKEYLLAVVAVLVLSLAAATQRLQASTDHPLESTGPPPPNAYEPIDEFQPDSEFFQAASPVGELALEMPNGETLPWCTGTVINANLVLTADHCITTKPPDSPGPTGMLFTLGRTRLRRGMSYELSMQPVDEGKDRGDDFVVLKSIKRFELSSLYVPNVGKDPVGRQQLYIIHRPWGNPLVLTRYRCHASEIPVVGIQLHHTCATDSGSSGAPILNERLELVGIHLAGGFGNSNKAEDFNEGLLLSEILGKSAVVKSSLLSRTSVVSKSIEPVRPPAPSVSILTSRGDTFVLIGDSWYLTPAEGGEAARVRLTRQRDGGQSYELWDATRDVQYELPRDSGTVRSKHGTDPTWTEIGNIVAH